MTASRKRRLWGSRWFLAGTMLAIVLVTFAARYYWDAGHVSPTMMVRVAIQAFLWIVLAHTALILDVVSTRAAPSIAGEKDRRTLDFLLATRLGNAEIVLGKLATCMIVFVADVAAGLPVMLLLHLLGGVDLRLILLAYAGLITTAFFMIALAIWVSTHASDLRQAGGGSVLWMFAWLGGPFFVSMIFPRFGIRLPGFLLTANAWVMASSPARPRPQDRRRRHAFGWAPGCGRLDERPASRRGCPPGDRGHRPAAFGLSTAASAATATAWPRG